MGFVEGEKPHLVLVPFPAQGHVNPFLQLAKILHSRGFYITFVNTEFNHQRLIKARGPDSVKGLDDFRFETIPDGLPPSDKNATQDVPSICYSTQTTCLVPFRDLVTRLNNTPKIPPVSYIVSDGVMSCTLDAAEQLGIPEILFWTTSACGFLCYLHYKKLRERGFTPFKDESCFTNGYLDTTIDWIPGTKDIRLRDIPSFIRTTDPDDIMLNWFTIEAERAYRGSVIILNTFDDLEDEVLGVLKPMLPPIYTVGPLSFPSNEVPDSRLRSMATNLWKDDTSYIEWLDSKEPDSVLYLSFGSVTVMSAEQLKEFAWGLASSKVNFLWISRPDVIMGDEAVLPSEFLEETKERGMITSWCNQEKVLSHPSVGGFLTHNGWNSTIESISSGVPVICWPFFAEQQTNARYCCTRWATGLEIDQVKREEVESLVRELMEGEKGKKLRKKAREWKGSAEKATRQGGSSYENLDKLVKEMLSGSIK